MSKETNEKNTFDSIESAITDIAAGKMVIVTDDESRENEGDLVMAASKVTAEAVNQMALHARGLICVPMLSDHLGSCLLYTSPSPRDRLLSRMPSSA